MDGCLPAGDESGDRKRHREPVVVEAVGGAATERGPAVDADVVAIDLDVGAQGGETRGDAGDPVGLLVPQLAGAADDRRPLCL